MAQEILNTPYPPHASTDSMKQVTKLLRQHTRHTAQNRPPLLAINHTVIGFFPYGRGPLPLSLKPEVITHDGKQQKAITIQYWTDGNQFSASGVMQHHAITYVHDDQGVTPYYSFISGNQSDNNVITSASPQFQQQARQLYRAIKQAVDLSDQRLYHLHRDYTFPGDQVFATRMLIHHLGSIMNAAPDQSLYRRFTSLATRAAQSFPRLRQPAA